MLGIFGKHIGMIWGKILGYPSTTYDGTDDGMISTSEPTVRLTLNVRGTRYYKMRPFVYGQRVSECDADFDNEEPTVCLFCWCTHEEKGRPLCDVLPCCFGLVGFGLKGEAAASDIKLRHGQWSGAVLNWQDHGKSRFRHLMLHIPLPSILIFTESVKKRGALVLSISEILFSSMEAHMDLHISIKHLSMKTAKSKVRKIKGPFSRNVLLTISWDGAKDQAPF
ncbi:hypothetical protein EJB05_23626, partial [Eragrostis curvula]